MAQKQKNSQSYRPGWIIGLFVLLFILTPAVTHALTRSYLTEDDSIKTGMVVATVPRLSDETTADALVHKANQSNSDLAVGVVTDVDASDLSFANGQQGELLVANTGQVQAYVSDVNGVPKAGDLLVPSPLDGILMKAGEGNSGIMGALASDFPSDKATEYKLKDGKTAKIAIATINMDVRPVNKPGFTNDLLKLISNLVGRDVTLVQVFAAAAILVLTLVVVGGMVYGAIANYLMSVGRNPLAKHILRKGFLQVMALIVVVMFVGLGCSWAVLWL